MENPNSPDRPIRVDAGKYQAKRDAIRAVLPQGAPGLTVAEAKERLSPEAPFPGGAKVGWWLKGLQLDLEAKGLIVRDGSKLLRL